MAKVIIIGGTKGLGAAIAESARRDGLSVLAISRQTSPGLDLSQREGLPAQMEILAPHLTDMEHLFLTAGVGYQGDLADQAPSNINAVIDTVVTGPLHLLSSLLKQRQDPFHLTTIASTTASKVRSNETTYGAAKAGQAQLARNFHQELLRVLPGSKSTLVHPGGMRTPFWDNSGVDISAYLDPVTVADTIWWQVKNQTTDWLEFSIIRGSAPGVMEMIEATPSVQFPG